MILLDFSALMHQMIFSSVKTIQPRKENEQYVTKDFINYTKYLILENIFDIQNRFRTYKDLVICLDNTRNGNWRKEVLGSYKSQRTVTRAKSDINYSEVFKEIDDFLDFLKLHSPYRVVSVSKAEGDDVILCLAKAYAKSEPIMIISSDKDMIQAQKHGDVKQYSLLTRKFITAESKADNMNDWLLEHVVLGDACDEVPRIIDDTVFSDDFENFLKTRNITLTPKQFLEHREKLETKFSELGFSKEYFKKERFGISTLKRRIRDFKTLDNWLDSNELYRINFERNKKLVLEEYIPEYVLKESIKQLQESSSEFNVKEFRKYLEENQLTNLESKLPDCFFTQKISADDFLDF